MAALDSRFGSRPHRSEDDSPPGVKGAGESGVAGSLPAGVNAVLDALSSRGVTHLDMPLTPMRVWQALNDRGGAT